MREKSEIMKKMKQDKEVSGGTKGAETRMKGIEKI